MASYYERNDALIRLVAPLMFLRFIGLSFLVPSVVFPQLPAAFAGPAAWGDLVAGVLAIIATIGLSRRSPWALPVSWVFNIWGAADLLFAFIRERARSLTRGLWEPPSLL